MPKRALVEKRPWLLASLVAGISFWFVAHTGLPGVQKIIWKASGVALLAVYALMRHRGRDSRQIALVMALGASGDALLEISELVGALSFLAGHIVATDLYIRHRRPAMPISQKMLGLGLVVLTPLIAYQLADNHDMAPGIAFYALGLGAMAGSAWISGFPRYRVGLGAVMFVVSDLLIFAAKGYLSTSPLPGLLIWPLYYFGQFLICTGVVGELRGRDQASA